MKRILTLILLACMVRAQSYNTWTWDVDSTSLSVQGPTRNVPHGDTLYIAPRMLDNGTPRTWPTNAVFIMKYQVDSMVKSNLWYSNTTVSAGTSGTVVAVWGATNDFYVKEMDYHCWIGAYSNGVAVSHPIYFNMHMLVAPDWNEGTQAQVPSVFVFASTGAVAGVVGEVINPLLTGLSNNLVAITAAGDAAGSNYVTAALGASGTVWRAEWTALITNEAALRLAGDVAGSNNVTAALGASGTVWRAEWTASTTNDAALRAAGDVAGSNYAASVAASTAGATNAAHVAASDPHGDRAYANTLLSTGTAARALSADWATAAGTATDALARATADAALSRSGDTATGEIRGPDATSTNGYVTLDQLNARHGSETTWYLRGYYDTGGSGFLATTADPPATNWTLTIPTATAGNYGPSWIVTNLSGTIRAGLIDVVGVGASFNTGGGRSATLEWEAYITNTISGGPMPEWSDLGSHKVLTGTANDSLMTISIISATNLAAGDAVVIRSRVAAAANTPTITLVGGSNYLSSVSLPTAADVNAVDPVARALAAAARTNDISQHMTYPTVGNLLDYPNVGVGRSQIRDYGSSGLWSNDCQMLQLGAGMTGVVREVFFTDTGLDPEADDGFEYLYRPHSFASNVQFRVYANCGTVADIFNPPTNALAICVSWAELFGLYAVQTNTNVKLITSRMEGRLSSDSGWAMDVGFSWRLPIPFTNGILIQIGEVEGTGWRPRATGWSAVKYELGDLPAGRLGRMQLRSGRYAGILYTNGVRPTIISEPTGYGVAVLSFDGSTHTNGGWSLGEANTKYIDGSGVTNEWSGSEDVSGAFGTFVYANATDNMQTPTCSFLNVSKRNAVGADVAGVGWAVANDLSTHPPYWRNGVWVTKMPDDLYPEESSRWFYSTQIYYQER